MQIEQDRASITSREKDLETRIQRLEKEVEHYQNENSELVTTTKQRQIENGKLYRTNMNLTNELRVNNSDPKAELGRLQNTLSAFQPMLTNIENQMQLLQTSSSAEVNRLQQETKQDILTVSREGRQLRTDMGNAAVVKQRDGLLKRNQKLQESNEQLQEEYNQKQEEYNQLRDNYSELHDQAIERIKSLKEQHAARVQQTESRKRPRLEDDVDANDDGEDDLKAGRGETNDPARTSNNEQPADSNKGLLIHDIRRADYQWGLLPATVQSQLHKQIGEWDIKRSTWVNSDQRRCANSFAGKKGSVWSDRGEHYACRKCRDRGSLCVAVHLGVIDLLPLGDDAGLSVGDIAFWYRQPK